jgi:hypothetical protein
MASRVAQPARDAAALRDAAACDSALSRFGCLCDEGLDFDCRVGGEVPEAQARDRRSFRDGVAPFGRRALRRASVNATGRRREK